jgi:hypothetical protein
MSTEGLLGSFGRIKRKGAARRLEVVVVFYRSIILAPASLLLQRDTGSRSNDEQSKFSTDLTKPRPVAPKT